VCCESVESRRALVRLLSGGLVIRTQTACLTRFVLLWIFKLQLRQDSNSTSELHRGHFAAFVDIEGAFARESPIRVDDPLDTGSVRCGPYDLYMQARPNYTVTMPHHTTS